MFKKKTQKAPEQNKQMIEKLKVCLLTGQQDTYS